MLKCNGIFIYLVFTITVAAVCGRRNDRFNISLAEAAFEYDLKSGSKIIENKQTYIETNNLQTNDDKKHQKIFFDFITDAIDILMKYSDSDLEHFFLIFNDEIKKYHYRGCKFYELTENVNFRMLVARNLLLIKDKPAVLLRQYLRAIHNEIEEAKLNINKRVLLDLINGLYSHDAVTKFGKILTNLYEYRMRDKQKMDLVKIIRSGIRSAIFDYFTELDHDARAKIKVSIDKYLEYYMSIVESLSTEKTNGNKESGVTDKKLAKKKSKRITLSNQNIDKDDDASDTETSVDNKSLLNKIMRQTDLQTIAVRKPLKSPYVKPVDREERVKHKKKQIYKKGKQEYDTTEYTLISSYGFRNNTHIMVFDLPLSHNVSEIATTLSRGHKISQIFNFKMNLNTDRKHFKEPKLYLKKPEFQVNFPAYPGKEMAHINRPNGQSLVDAPIFSHKNYINVRRMFDTGHIVKQVNRGITFLPIQTVQSHKGAKIIQGRRYLPHTGANATVRVPVGLNSDTETNKRDTNTIGKTNADNNDQSQLPHAMDNYTKTLQKKKVRVDLKFNFDTIKKIITYPFDAIKNALSKKTSKPKKSTPNTKENKNKTKIEENNNKNVQVNHKNIQNITTMNDNRLTKPYSVNKTSTVITSLYQRDGRTQHNNFHNTTAILNAKKYVLANKTDKTQVVHQSTKVYITNVTQKRVKTKTEKEKAEHRLGTNYFNDQKPGHFRAKEFKELPPSIYLLENYKNMKNMPDVFKNKNAIVKKKNEVKDATRRTTAYKEFKFTDSIDRFQYLRHLMDTYISHNNNFTT